MSVTSLEHVPLPKPLSEPEWKRLLSARAKMLLRRHAVCLTEPQRHPLVATVSGFLNFVAKLESLSPDDKLPNALDFAPPRQCRTRGKANPITQIQRIERRLKRSVVTYSVDENNRVCSVTFANGTQQQQSDTDRELAEFEASHDQN